MAIKRSVSKIMEKEMTKEELVKMYGIRFGEKAPSGPFRRKGVVGMENKGNDCYMNAALQCLCHTSLLANYILSDEFINEINTKETSEFSRSLLSFLNCAL